MSFLMHDRRRPVDLDMRWCHSHSRVISLFRASLSLLQLKSCVQYRFKATHNAIEKNRVQEAVVQLDACKKIVNQMSEKHEFNKVK
jgi:hypothetical protein